jgi:hypothetical protein
MVVWLAPGLGLVGCTGSSSIDPPVATSPSASYRDLDSAVSAGVALPGLVDGFDGHGDLLVRLSGAVAATDPQLHGDGYGYGYAIMDESGRRIDWPAQSPVADGYQVAMTSAGLFVERQGDAWDLSRVSPRTGGCSGRSTRRPTKAA